MKTNFKKKKKKKEQTLATLREELEKLRKGQKLFPQFPQNQPKSKNNNKISWAIGLGIVAAVIGLICLIFLVTIRKER